MLGIILNIVGIVICFSAVIYVLSGGEKISSFSSIWYYLIILCLLFSYYLAFQFLYLYHDKFETPKFSCIGKTIKTNFFGDCMVLDMDLWIPCVTYLGKKWIVCERVCPDIYEKWNFKDFEDCEPNEEATSTQIIN